MALEKTTNCQTRYDGRLVTVHANGDNIFLSCVIKPSLRTSNIDQICVGSLSELRVIADELNEILKIFKFWNFSNGISHLLATLARVLAWSREPKGSGRRLCRQGTFFVINNLQPVNTYFNVKVNDIANDRRIDSAQ